MFLLAGDVGGTKTDLAVFSAADGLQRPIASTTLPSKGYDSLDALVREFLSTLSVRVDLACFGIAGPVVKGRVTATNLPWTIEERLLQESLGLSKVRLINDLGAAAHAIPFLEPHQLYTVNEGHPEAEGPIAVIAPGTGLGVSYLTLDSDGYRPHSSEGGHVDFAPVTPLESALLEYLHRTFEHVSYERVCSGIGIPNIYAFLRDLGAAEEPEWLATQLAGVTDIVPVIAAAAVPSEGREAANICVMTLNMFISILAAATGNLALTVWATGGVFIGGGIVPHMMDRFEGPVFMDQFCRKGRFNTLLRHTPVHIILEKKSALLGAARYALRMA